MDKLKIVNRGDNYAIYDGEKYYINTGSSGDEYILIDGTMIMKYTLLSIGGTKGVISFPELLKKHGIVAEWKSL